MRSRTFLVVLISALATAGPARGALDLNLSGPILCAVTDVYDCSGKECSEVESEVVGVPDLLRLDPGSKALTALDVELAGAGSALESVAIENGSIAARAREGDRALVLSIDPKTGEAIVTVTDLGLALIAYGACAQP